MFAEEGREGILWLWLGWGEGIFTSLPRTFYEYKGGNLTRIIRFIISTKKTFRFENDYYI